MFRRFDICIVLFLALNACYWVVLNALNSLASPFAAFVLPALFIVPAAVYMKAVSAAVVVAFAAFATSCNEPVNSFAVCAVWVGVALVVNAVRFRFRGAGWLSSVALMEIANTAVFLYCALAFPFGAQSVGAYVERVFSDWAFSGLALVFCARFCMDLPVAIAGFFGVDITVGEDI